MKHLGLFEGIGGFSLAARWMGWDTVAWSEINPFCRKVLSYHFPKAEPLGNIKDEDFTRYKGAIDIISGGFPCQPYSVAGKRKGKDDDRHLWPEKLRAIREVAPRWVVGENVRGLVSWNGGMVFDEVCADLEAAGYEVQPFLLPACAVDAPHKRERIWFVAYSGGKRISEHQSGIIYNQQQNGEVEGQKRQQPGRIGAISEKSIITDTENTGLQFTGEHGTGGMDLRTYVQKKMLPTPNASEGYKYVVNLNENSQMGTALTPVLNKITGQTGQLNPRFVAEMMGFPPDWTLLPFLMEETPEKANLSPGGEPKA